jgi:hypothetical protein
MNLPEWVKFLEDLVEWVSNIDCEEPAGMNCSKIDSEGGEEPCWPCKCREAYSKIMRRV